MQEYISHPLLLNGYKFDLRLYILVTSFQPLEVFLYDEGFARLTTQKYSIDPDDVKNKLIHLTNSSIQMLYKDDMKYNTAVSHATNSEGGGTKITLSYLKELLKNTNINFDNIWNDIKKIILKSLMAVDDLIGFQPNCFEMYGYDILIDYKYKPWLIEINASPSMARETPMDVKVKTQLIQDIINLVDPIEYDRISLQELLLKLRSECEEHRLRPYKVKQDPDITNVNLYLSQIFKGKSPRKYGEMPKNMGGFSRLYPGTSLGDEIQKIVQSAQKLVKKKY